MSTRAFYRLIIIIIIAACNSIAATAADPTATAYTYDQCCGSALPYVAPATPAAIPDTLTPIFLNHVGRHGARYQASPNHCRLVASLLANADSASALTPLGRELQRINNEVVSRCEGRWGALDSLGMAEQWGIAARMYRRTPCLFRSDISAISSYSPRCVMSMYCFLHQISRLDNHVEIDAQSGRRYSPLMRFFDTDKPYRDFVAQDIWRESVASLQKRLKIDAMLGKFVTGTTAEDPAAAMMAIYSVLAGCAAMDYDVNPDKFFTRDEWNAMWQCFNLRQYLLHSASTMSGEPADIAAPLLMELISTCDQAVSDAEAGRTFTPVRLRFGHAETLMPLLALMRLPGCYYLTNYFDTVGLHWRDFDIVPMAANLQMILLKSETGKIYVMTLLNEEPMSIVAGDTRFIIPWSEARAALERCVPLYFR